MNENWMERQEMNQGPCTNLSKGYVFVEKIWKTRTE